MLPQPLEHRRLFASVATATLDDGILRVLGTDLEDRFNFILFQDGVDVTRGTNGNSLGFFEYDDIDRMILKSFASDDVMHFSDVPFPSRIEGGKGNDTISGTAKKDVILGGSGNDSIDGARGDDTVKGGSGDDEFVEIRGKAFGSDVYRGGKGFDHIYYSGRSTSSKLSLDNKRNDGQAGEKDNIHSDIEHLVGGNGNDTLIGSNGADVLDPRAGNDAVEAKGGKDRIEIADLQLDAVSGGGGRDTVVADIGDLINPDIEKKLF